MALFSSILQVTLLIIVVVLIFNVIIFVHELGHFLAAKWRGLQVDRFQIWFGRAIWKKEINGVQYGLGWIPAGGFVSLPQMAPMESIEGESLASKTLPPVKPIDKIIVALAGPVFSMLLALTAATVVWGVGKPKDFIPTQVIGTVVPGSPGEKAGLKVGDKITHINGAEVNGYAGSLDSIMENIVLSKGDRIEFVVERPGEEQPRKLISEFRTEQTKWFQRSGLRKVGIGPKIDHIEIEVTPDSPSSRAGLQSKDFILSMDGIPLQNAGEGYAHVKQAGLNPIVIEYSRKGVVGTTTVQPLVPLEPANLGPKIGLGLYDSPYFDETIVHPTPFRQVKDSVRNMWTTITSLIDKDSSIGIDQLSGPIGIAKVKYQLLQMDHPWERILGFMVLFNVNLAILNMMPFPVLDGGHVVLAILEKIFGRPVKATILQVVQTGFAVCLMGLMLYVSSKDIGDSFGPKPQKIVFPAE
jgi:regulator of sigma E protease